MPNQAQQAPGTSQTQIDPTALTLSRAIRQVESGDNPNAKGASGEFGIGQWMPGNFESAATKYGLDPNDKSQANQEHVLYNQVEEQVKAGHSQSEIASWWNSGKYDPTGNVGINKEGVKYDTPAYVAKVQKAYEEQLQNGQPQQSAIQPPSQPGSQTQTGSAQSGGYAPPKPPTPTTVNTPDQTQAPQESVMGDISQGNFSGALLKGIGDIGSAAFPIIPDIINAVQGKNDKSALQLLGDAGMSALWFLPFGDIAEGVGLGAKALGLGETAAKTTGLLGTSLATGYAGDVSSNLAQGKTDASAFTPGLGTVLGGALPVAGLAGAKIYNRVAGEQNVLNKVQQAYEDALGATKTGIQKSSKVVARSGTSPAEFLANAGLPPETQEIGGRRVFTTGEDSNTYKTIQQRANDLTALRDKAIEKTNGVSNLEDLRASILKQAEGEFSGTERQKIQDHINQEFDSYAQQFSRDGSGNVSIKDLNTIKKDLQGKSNYDATRPSAVTRANKLAASLTKEQVEKDAQKAGTPSIRALNKIIQQHLDFLNTDGKKGILAKLNGQTIKGGRLGTYVKEGIGAGIGSAAGGALGGGLLGEIGGGLAGAKAGELVSRWMQRLAVGGPMTAATIGRMASKDPQVVEQFLKFLGTKGEKIAPTVIPKSQSSASVLTGLLRKSPGQKFVNSH